MRSGVRPVRAPTGEDGGRTRKGLLRPRPAHGPRLARRPGAGCVASPAGPGRPPHRAGVYGIAVRPVSFRPHRGASVPGGPATESALAVSREDSRPAGHQPTEARLVSPVGTVRRPGATRRVIVPLTTADTAGGPSGPARFRVPEGGVPPQLTGEGRARLALNWTRAGERRKMACWVRWPHRRLAPLRRAIPGRLLSLGEFYFLFGRERVQ